MKCVCGYEYEESWDNGKLEKVKGDEEFIQVDCHMTIREDMKDKEVKLYACPKCNTLKILSNRGWNY